MWKSHPIRLMGTQHEFISFIITCDWYHSQQSNTQESDEHMLETTSKTRRFELNPTIFIRNVTFAKNGATVERYFDDKMTDRKAIKERDLKYWYQQHVQWEAARSLTAPNIFSVQINRQTVLLVQLTNVLVWKKPRSKWPTLTSSSLRFADDVDIVGWCAYFSERLEVCIDRMRCVRSSHLSQ